MFGIDLSEILMTIMIILIIIGGTKLPEVGRSLSEAIRDTRNKNTPDEAVDEAVEEGR